MELYYKTTLDKTEYNVVSVQVDGLEKLRDAKRVIIDENEWGDTAKVSFFRIVSNKRQPLLLATRLSKVLPGNNEENPLLMTVSLPKQQTPLLSGELMRGTKRQLDALEYFGRPTPIETPASVGRKAMIDLQDNARFSQVDDNPSLPAVLDDDSIQRLSQLRNEHQVVAFLVPVFEEILKQVPGLHVVNSEECPWLVTRSDDSRFNQKHISTSTGIPIIFFFFIGRWVREFENKGRLSTAITTNGCGKSHSIVHVSKFVPE